MADTTQQQIDQFQSELGKIQDRVLDLRNLLGDKLTESLTKNIVEARRLSDPLKDASSIAKKMNDLVDKNEVLIIKQKVAQENYTKALQKGNAAKIASAEKQYQLITAQLKLQQGIEDQLKALQQIAEEEKKLEEQKKKENNLTEFLLTKYKNLKKELTGLFALGSIVDMLFKGSENIANFRKDLGLSYGNAYKLNTELSFIGASINDTYITGEKLKKSFSDLSKEMGFVADYGVQSLVTMTNLTGRLGMSNKEAAQLTTLSRFQSKDTEKVLDNVGKTVSSMNKQKGTAILLKDIMKDIGNVSMATAVSLGKNPVAIAEAVVAAKQLGTTLEQMEKTADSLLNFETSIENELKAELLTGKEMNLERARAAALSNDMKTLSEEIGKNQEVINTFSKGNRLEQQAVAESLGMSREDLAKMIYQQEAMKIGAEGVRKKYGEQAYENLKAQNAQEKFTNAVEKLKSAISGIVQVFSPVLDLLAAMADHSWIVYGIFGLWLFRSNLLAGSFKGILGSIKDVGKNLISKAIPAAPIPAVGGGGGLGGFMGMMPSASSMLKGAAAILVLAGALFVAAKAFQEFATVKWGDMAKAGVALVGLSLVAMALGKAKGAILEGAAAIAILGIALIPLSFALKLAAPAIEAFDKVVGTIITSIASGISTIVESIGNMIVKLGEVGPSLLLLGPALLGIAAGLGAISLTGLLAMPAILALTALGTVAPVLSSLGIGGGGGKEEKNNEMATLISAVNAVKASIDRLYTKDTSINMDGKKVGTTLTQGSTKLA